MYGTVLYCTVLHSTVLYSGNVQYYSPAQINDSSVKFSPVESSQSFFQSSSLPFQGAKVSEKDAEGNAPLHLVM